MQTIASANRVYGDKANEVARLYKAVMPDLVIPLLAPRVPVISELAKAVRSDKDPVNITKVMGEISEVPDKSIVTDARKKPGTEAKTISSPAPSRISRRRKSKRLGRCARICQRN
ncbi:MAG: hypothetical protein Q8Q59_13315 [Luteolibacter sp.]|nr:hypothetical protein [Luteolibacter sp.]